MKFRISAGKMVEDGSYMFDSLFLPTKFSAPIVVLDGPTTYICEQKFTKMLDGH